VPNGDAASTRLLQSSKQELQEWARPEVLGSIHHEREAVMAKVPQLKLSQKQVEDAVRTLLSWAGDDPDRQGLKETPSRVARALALKAALGKFHIFQQLSNIEQRVGHPEEQVSSHHRSASWAVIGDRECALPPIRGKHHVPVSTPFVHPAR
jgi:hypothetical protein